MSYTVMTKAILVPMPLDEIPIFFGNDLIPYETKNDVTKYMIRRSNMVEDYILSDCDERFPSEILQDFIDNHENN